MSRDHSHNGDEDALVAEATRTISTLEGVADTEVVAAGVFSLQELLAAQMAGNVGGAAAAAAAGGHGTSQAVSAVVGGRVAVEAAASAQGASVGLVVAVTTSAIHVLNRPDDGHSPEIARFDRSTAEVTIKKMGLSRIVELLDPATGMRISLHGSVSPLSAQSKPDKLVMHLLSA